jgi:hypothetical protein
VADHGLPRRLRAHTEGDGHVGPEPEAHVVRPLDLLAEGRARRRLELDQHLGAGDREALARADVEGHPRPAPVVDLEPHRGERLHVRIGCDAGLVAVAAELPAHDAPGSSGAIASSTRAFSSRSVSGWPLAARPWPDRRSPASRWFSMTSRMAPSVVEASRAPRRRSSRPW